MLYLQFFNERFIDKNSYLTNHASRQRPTYRVSTTFLLDNNINSKYKFFFTFLKSLKVKRHINGHLPLVLIYMRKT